MRWKKHENTFKDSEPTNHLKENVSHKFSWEFCLEHQRTNKLVRLSKILKSREKDQQDEV